MLKRSFLSLAFLLLVGATATAETGDRPFTLGTLARADEMMPYKQYSGASSPIRELLFPPILKVGRDGRIRCVLCKEVPRVEIRKGDRSTFIITMELKKDLHWGDGKPIVAKDVKFTLEQMAKANYPRGAHPILPIKRIELDKEIKGKITLILKHRRSDAFQLFAISLLPFHKAKDLEGISAHPSRSIELLKDKAYSYGPYRVETATEGSFRLVSNEKTEWEDKPDDDLEIRFFKDARQLASAMRSASIDRSDELAWDAYRSIKSTWPEIETRYAKESSPSDRMQVLLLNLRSPILVNPQLRQALYHALDRDALNKMQYEGLATTGNGLISDPFAERLDRPRKPPFNLTTAAQILDQSGWDKKEGGIRVSEGEKLVLRLSCPKERLDESWLTKLSSDLLALGVRLERETPSNDAYVKNFVAERRFKDLACVSWDFPQLSIPNNLFHSLAIPMKENNYFGSNYSAWDAHVVDRLLDNMLRETDLHQFVRQFERLDKQFMSDLPGIPLVYKPQVTLVLKTPAVQPSEELSRVLQTPTQIRL